VSLEARALFSPLWPKIAIVIAIVIAILDFISINGTLSRETDTMSRCDLLKNKGRTREELEECRLLDEACSQLDGIRRVPSGIEGSFADCFCGGIEGKAISSPTERERETEKESRAASPAPVD